MVLRIIFIEIDTISMVFTMAFWHAIQVQKRTMWLSSRIESQELNSETFDWKVETE